MCPQGRLRGQGRPRGLHLCCKLANSNRIAIKTLKKSTKHWKLLSGYGFVQYIALNCRFLVGETKNHRTERLPSYNDQLICV